MFTGLGESNVNKENSVREKGKGRFDKCVMEEKLIRQKAAKFDFSS